MLRFITKSFNELCLIELYELLKLRQEVFIVEQDCPYLDADGVDYVSHHVLGFDEEGTLLAHTRLVPIGASYPEYASIGRVVTGDKARGKGMGKALMEYSITQVLTIFEQTPIKISAQNYLLAFYTNLGFEAVGDSYLEDGIPHTGMVLKV